MIFCEHQALMFERYRLSISRLTMYRWLSIYRKSVTKLRRNVTKL